MEVWKKGRITLLSVTLLWLQSKQVSLRLSLGYEINVLISLVQIKTHQSFDLISQIKNPLHKLPLNSLLDHLKQITQHFFNIK